MSLRTVVMFVTLVTSVGLSPTAHGSWWHTPGRAHGFGWGDGYQSRTGCAPKRGACPTCGPGMETQWHGQAPWYGVMPSESKLAVPTPAEPLPRTSWRLPSPTR
jgi:hypothetical protein